MLDAKTGTDGTGDCRPITSISPFDPGPLLVEMDMIGPDKVGNDWPRLTPP
jgi:hypothetical protein